MENAGWNQVSYFSFICGWLHFALIVCQLIIVSTLDILQFIKRMKN